jgi:hypothetical protein
MVGGLAETKLWLRFRRGSLLESSPGLGREGSFRFRLKATWERRRSLGIRPRRGEPRLLVEERLEDSLAAFVMAALARDIEEARGEGVSLRLGGEVAVDIERGCMGEEDIDRDGGRELRSGGAMVGIYY